MRPVEFLWEIQDIIDIGTTETINGLVIIADNTDIVLRRNQKRQQFMLRRVRVLIFIDHDILDFFLQFCLNVRMFLQKPNRIADKVIKIHCIGVFQAFLIFLVKMCNGVVGRNGAL